MKTLLAWLVLCSTVLLAADAPTPTEPADDYNAFIKQCMKRECIAECIALMDRLITAGEHGLVDKEPDQGMVEGTTSFGLHIEFSAGDLKEAVIYYLRVSRGGKPLQYSDAVSFVALFTDRAGLPHPVEVVEGDRSLFYAQWLIKPSSWKSMHKMINKVRAENRSITDPERALVVAVGREREARAAVQSNQ